IITTIFSCCCLTFCKFLIFYNYICCINLLTVSICVASCLNPSSYYNLCSLMEILFCKFCCTVKCYTLNKVSGCLTVISTSSTVYCQCISFNCHLAFSL